MPRLRRAHEGAGQVAQHVLDGDVDVGGRAVRRHLAVAHNARGPEVGRDRDVPAFLGMGGARGGGEGDGGDGGGQELHESLRFDRTGAGQARKPVRVAMP